MKQIKPLDDVEILKQAKWNKDTSYPEQISSFPSLDPIRNINPVKNARQHS